MCGTICHRGSTGFSSSYESITHICFENINRTNTSFNSSEHSQTFIGLITALNTLKHSLV